MKVGVGAVAALVVVATLAVCGPASADVPSTLQTAGDDIITWVRAGAVLAVIACGVSMVRGWMGAWAFAPMLVGLAIAISPEAIVSWIG